jgi:P27 family predicted phage terminase small subunit
MKSSNDALTRRGSRVAHKRKQAEATHPDAVTTAPPAPSWLSEGGKSMWAIHAPEAASAGLLTSCDLLIFGLLCDSLHQYCELRDQVALEGSIIVRDHYCGPNPAAKLRDDASKTILALSRQCGLTPTSRVGLKISPPSKKPAGEISLFAKER